MRNVLFKRFLTIWLVVQGFILIEYVWIFGNLPIDQIIIYEMLKFIDLFAGIGGIKIAFENAGFHCVFSNDFDSNAKITFDLNFSGPFEIEKQMVLGDIQKISTNKIPDCDILCGGFPCQPFSVAGYRQGFEDERGRGNLFFDIIRILKDKKPKAFLLENVKNLKTHDKGNTITVICQELQKLGYKITDKVLNSMKKSMYEKTRMGIAPHLQQIWEWKFIMSL